MGVVTGRKAIWLAVLAPHPLPQKIASFVVVTNERSFIMRKKHHGFDAKTIAVMGVLVAMEVILSRFLSISAWNIKIGFNFVPLVLAAMLLGPVKAGIVGALADFIGATLFPIGPYFPGFTLTSFLMGVVFGIFLYKRQNPVKITAAVAINQLVLSLLLNTFWISVLYGSPFGPLLLTRIWQTAVLVPVQLLVILIISKVLMGKLSFVME